MECDPVCFRLTLSAKVVLPIRLLSLRQVSPINSQKWSLFQNPSRYSKKKRSIDGNRTRIKVYAQKSAALLSSLLLLLLLMLLMLLLLANDVGSPDMHFSSICFRL